MFSVLIMNQKTQESFQKFHPLFLEHLKKNDIAICRWIESGYKIDSALPDIRDLTDDKENWRAIIVHLEDNDDSDMKRYPRNINNPFDFTINHEKEAPYGESEIPLVRLTHLLKGFPEPEVKYPGKRRYFASDRPDEIDEYGHEVNTDLYQIYYEPQVDSEEQRRYEQLSMEYDFDGKHPTEVILISVRINSILRQNNEKEIWITHNEIESSNFWRTNRYADGCRFITFDMSRKGNTEHEADLFKFWSSVLLIATNHIDTNELQAYRLYRLQISISRKRLLRNLQRLSNKMLGAKEYIEHIVQNQINAELAERKKLPDYSIEVPVILDLPQRSSYNVQKDAFSGVTGSISNDLLRWNAIQRDSDLKIKSNIHQSERVLDDSAERMHEFLRVLPSEVRNLNKFLKREMNQNLDDLFESIITSQKDLPNPNKTMDKLLFNSSEKVTKLLKGQLIKGHLEAMLIILLLMLGSIGLPAVVHYMFLGQGAISTLVILLLIIAFLGITIVLAFIWQKKIVLGRAIADYNVALNNAIDKIVKNKELYSKFLGSIATHSRGCSYLQILNHKKFVLTNMEEIINTHERSIDYTVINLRRWAKAFYLDLDVTSDIPAEELFEIKDAPKINTSYTFEYGEEYEVPINHSGQVLESPFDYIDRLDLVREEIYENG